MREAETSTPTRLSLDITCRRIKHRSIRNHKPIWIKLKRINYQNSCININFPRHQSKLQKLQNTMCPKMPIRIIFPLISLIFVEPAFMIYHRHVVTHKGGQAVNNAKKYGWFGNLPYGFVRQSKTGKSESFRV
jgi:hypothetical protein